MPAATLRSGDGDRLRKEKFSELMHSTWYVGLLVVLPSIALVVGASQRNALIAFGGPVVLAIVIYAIGRGIASSAAETAVMSGFAQQHGLQMLPNFAPQPLTPLLGAGDERKLEWAMGGEMAGMQVLLGHYTYTDITDRTDSKGNRHRERTDHRFTIATTEVEAAMKLMPTLYLRPRGRFLDFGTGWLHTRGLSKCETESIAFNERFQTWCRDGQDQIVLRRMLDPSVVDTLANHPLKLGVELSAGQLLVYIPEHCTDSGELGGLVDALAYVRKCVEQGTRVAL